MNNYAQFKEIVKMIVTILQSYLKYNQINTF